MVILRNWNSTGNRWIPDHLSSILHGAVMEEGSLWPCCSLLDFAHVHGGPEHSVIEKTPGYQLMY
jgi:hypothetical protein